MTPMEAESVVEFLVAAWPQAMKFWPLEHRDLFQHDLESLSLAPDQCIARLRQLARVHGTTLPDLRKDVWAALEALDRSQTAQSSAKSGPGHEWSLVEHLRHGWGHPWTEMSDDEIMWQYAKNRTRNPRTGRADEIGSAMALEFETRSLGWNRDRIRRLLLDKECYVGLDSVQRDWEREDEMHEAFMSRKASIEDGGAK